MKSDIQDQVLDLIDRGSTEQLDFLITLCEENSYTFNKPGSDRVSGLIMEKLEGVFPVHRRIEQKKVGNHHILKSRDTEKAVFLLGHTDTVFPPEHPFQTCPRKGDWLNGPGTADMKGGLVVMVYALKALHQTGVLEKLNVAMILGSDEENGSVTSQGIYAQERENAFLCLVAECAGENEEFVASRNGKAGSRLESHGYDQHVSTVTPEKTSAVLELAHKVIALESLNGVFPGVLVNVGRIEGGLGPGTVPAQASLLFDIRWEKEEHYTPLLERLQKITAHCYSPRSQCRLTVLNHRPAMPFGKQTERFLSLLKKTADGLGQNFSTEHRRGTSDANFFGAVGVPTLDGFGPVGIRDHTPEERILIPSLKERTSLLALFLLGLAK